MAFRTQDTASLAQAFEGAFHQASSWRERGCAVDVLVPQGSWEDAAKLGLPHGLSCGVRVQSYAHWLAGLWELYGDGRALASRTQKSLLLRPLLAELLGFAPSKAYLAQFASFASAALPVIEQSGAPRGELTAKEEEALSQVAAYAQVLSERGFIDEGQAASFLAQAGITGLHVAAVDVCRQDSQAAAFLQALAAENEVVAFDHSLQAHLSAAQKAADCAQNGIEELSARLYTGFEGLQPRGGVRALEVQGLHAQPQALAQALRDLHDGEQSCALVLKDPASAFPETFDALAQAGVPFECGFSLPLQRTAFGAAFLQLMEIRSCAERVQAGEELPLDEAYEAEVSFMDTPFSGIDATYARALQIHWRSLAHATPHDRIIEMRDGFKGNHDRKLWPEKADGLRTLLDLGTSLQDCVRTMFDAGRAAGLSHEELVDAKAAAHALLDYLDAAAELGIQPSAEEASNLQVSLQRAYGSGKQPVHIVGTGECALAFFDCVVMAGLDVDSYRMATPESPFDGLAAACGLAPLPDQADALRLQLLQILESTKRTFVFSRSCNDELGEDLCQSALWDELVAPYRTGRDADLPAHEVPPALKEAGCWSHLSEEEVFRAQASAGSAASFELVRGEIRNADALALLPMDQANHKETYSPTGLEDYYRCPYLWFINRRVGSNSLDASFGPIAMGNLAHAVFRRFYEQMAEAGVPRVTSDNIAQALEIAEEAFAWQLDHEIERHRVFLRSQADRLACDEVHEQVMHFIEREADFLPGYEPRYLELKLEKPDGSPIEYAGVPVRGHVDRIDVDAQGHAVVIDYKLSGLSAGYGFAAGEALPQRIQTDIYASMVQKYFDLNDIDCRVVGSVYRSYAKNNLRGVYESSVDWGLLEECRPAHDAIPNEEHNLSYQAYLQKVEERVATLVKELARGDIAPRPLSEDACAFCLATSFCAKGGK